MRQPKTGGQLGGQVDYSTNIEGGGQLPPLHNRPYQKLKKRHRRFSSYPDSYLAFFVLRIPKNVLRARLRHLTSRSDTQVEYECKLFDFSDSTALISTHSHKQWVSV